MALNTSIFGLQTKNKIRLVRRNITINIQLPWGCHLVSFALFCLLDTMETVLPHTRIRTIMKSSLDTGNITNEVLYLMTKSTELFIKHFSTESYIKAKKPSILKYEHLANLVQNEDNLEFLLQIVPQKIKVRDFKALIEQDGGSSESSSESD